MINEIKKGDVFLCIQDYVMDRGDIAYFKGGKYISHNDGCITDNDGDRTHMMHYATEPDLDLYFTKDLNCNLNTEEVHKEVDINDLKKVLVLLGCNVTIKDLQTFVTTYKALQKKGNQLTLRDIDEIDTDLNRF